MAELSGRSIRLDEPFALRALAINPLEQKNHERLRTRTASRAYRNFSAQLCHVGRKMINQTCLRLNYLKVLKWVAGAQIGLSVIFLVYSMFGSDAMFGFPFPVFTYIIFTTAALVGDFGLKFHPLALVVDLFVLVVASFFIAVVLCRRRARAQPGAQPDAGTGGLRP